jgi:hypothetical protein
VLQEVRLHEVLPAKSYFPSWMRARAPSQDPELPSSSLATPNLANTIHGSLHGGNAFADQKWGAGGAASQQPPGPLPGLGFKPPPPLDLHVLGAHGPNTLREVRRLTVTSGNPLLVCWLHAMLLAV